ncbi:zinc-binding alcohol dehydrogenase family protein [Staphylococcus hyicus]|uniref:zinc-binding alcohol dehydrogenase family protein n=1 Tax=Staphylococcus hyicus TaxID=1284 RepID=UPI00208F8F91|nr:zinc-binding alcohol dehydrogenase family protein [Staphylococcus hyicus]MCO4331159.1 zinc-binding alcohol dehydrogenase family protein [Staphylococcus hyicus]MCO4333456.1 zinc-binding alcohol dehydrogenase family protein [Staphylococcus hyicus]
MKAIISKQPFQLIEGNLFEEVQIDAPTLAQNEVRVKVHAIGVNPVDTKIRQSPLQASYRILGYDAAGEVVEVGSQVNDFQIGDRVFYSGSNQRAGSNQTYQTIPTDFIAHMPEQLSYEDAAALPLTAITAYETLFDVFKISKNAQDNKNKTLLIINGAGGVGSIATQIAKAYGLTVVTTAGREETKAWSLEQGADVVLNHKYHLKSEWEQHQLDSPDFIFCTYDTDAYYEQMIDIVKPRGHIATIVAFQHKQDLNLLKQKSITLTHEFMFSRAIHHDDIGQYQTYLKDVADKIEKQHYFSTRTKTLQGLSVDTVYEAHQQMEQQQCIGKLVIKVI